LNEKKLPVLGQKFPVDFFIVFDKLTVQFATFLCANSMTSSSINEESSSEEVKSVKVEEKDCSSNSPKRSFHMLFDLRQ
jgi:hypothetical protein